MSEMCLNKNIASIRKQSGISMAFLLFTIIIVSLLAAALMRLNSQSNISNAHQVISTRAFFAAESGANLHALAIFPVAGGGGSAACVNTSYNFTNIGLNACTATVVCSTFTIDTKNYYEVSSEGQCNIGQALQATRTITVRLKGINTP
jgi:MSHA biogenesis protein MshP